MPYFKFQLTLKQKCTTQTNHLSPKRQATSSSSSPSLQLFLASPWVRITLICPGSLGSQALAPVTAHVHYFWLCIPVPGSLLSWMLSTQVFSGIVAKVFSFFSHIWTWPGHNDMRQCPPPSEYTRVFQLFSSFLLKHSFFQLHSTWADDSWTRAYCSLFAKWSHFFQRISTHTL